MGRLSLQAMLEHASNRRAVLEWHLTSNHYPPHPKWMIGVAEAAIEACKNDEPDKRITLPEGVSHKRHGTEVPARVIVEELHLAEFLEPEDGK